MIPIKTRHMILLFLGALAIAMAIFWYNYSALGYSLSDLTTFFLAKDSRVQERLIMQPGTSTGVSIVAGTQTDTWLSNPDDLTLPRIELNGITGKWTFKHRDSGTTTNELSSLTQALADNRYVQQNAGTGSNNTFTNPTCSGGTQSGNTELIGNYIIGTETVAKQKTQYLADVTGYVQSQLNSKENSANKGVANGYASLDVNGKVVENPANGTETSGAGKIPIQTVNGLDSWLVNTYVNKIRGSSGDIMQGQIDIVFEGDIVGTSTYDSGSKRGTQTVTLSAVASNRADILEGGIVFGTQSTEINFDSNHFNGTQSSGRSTLTLSDENAGTTSSAPGYVVKQDGSGKIPVAVRPDYLSYWEAQGFTGTGTIHLITDGYATSSASYDGNGNGTVTIKTLPRIFFTATNTTWVVPAGVQVIFVDMVGGGAGGAGGGRGSTNEGGRGGGGGGSGEAFIDFPILVQPGQSFNITIGKGGNAGVGAIFPSSSATNGGNGGDSSFGNYLTAKGGSGGTAGGDGSSAPGVGGAGGDGGSLYYDGFDGYSGSTAGAESESPGGNGARSKFGLPGTSTGGGIGLSGVGYGSGGGGGQGGAISGNGYSGGTGTAGFCVIKF